MPWGPKPASGAGRWPLKLGIMLILAIAAAGCGSDEDVNPPAPIDTTVTPAGIVLPTSALAQPEAVSRDLATALTKTRTATVYRISFDFQTGTGEPGQVPTQPYVSFDGEIAGNSNHITYNGGAFTEMLGNVSRVEVITIEENTYLKGGRLFGIAEPDKWYRMLDSGLSKPPFEVDDLLQMIGQDVNGARPSGVVNLDEQTCQAWSLNVKAEAGSLVNAAPHDQPDSTSIVDSAEAHFTTCPDGYVHRMEWNVLSHDSTSAADKSSIAITVHLFDFNATNVVITPPPNPLELK
jgi:hypothetical protein